MNILAIIPIMIIAALILLSIGPAIDDYKTKKSIKKEREMITRYRNVAVPKVQHILATVNSCETLDQIKACQEWALDTVNGIAEEMTEMSAFTTLGLQLGNDLVKEVREVIFHRWAYIVDKIKDL